MVLATLAAVIASQAVISGAYSMTRQAIQLGFLPRMRVRLHLGAARRARSTCRAVNWRAAGRGAARRRVGFGSSSALAGAYGIAVTLTMLITTLLTYFVVRHGWGYPLPVALGATGCSSSLDALLVDLVRAQVLPTAAGSRWCSALRSSP